MISTEKFKEFILDTDSDVRREAACYFYEGHIQDSHILPLTLQACRQYGFDDCSLLLHYATRQVVDDFNAAKLLNILREPNEVNVQMHLTHLLSNASISFLEKNIDTMPTQFDKRQWNFARNRLKFDSFSEKELWHELKDYSAKHTNKKIVAGYCEPLIATLAKYDYPDPSRISELIEENEGKWLELFLIELAAERKIEQAIPVINRKLAEDNIFLSDTCSKALARIGTEAVVNAIREGCKSGSCEYQISASDILGRIKLPQSETVILELLENNKTLSHDTHCYLCFGLCDLFSEKAFQYGPEVLDDAEAIEIDSMRERLIVLSRVLDYPLTPETLEKWKKEIALEPQLRSEQRQKDNPELFRLGETLRNIVEGSGASDIFSGLGENTPSGRKIESIRNKPSMKIGRNSLCYCGSGKKYKKCCINN